VSWRRRAWAMRRAWTTMEVGGCTRIGVSSIATYEAASRFLTVATSRSPRAIASRPWSLKKPLTINMEGCRLDALMMPCFPSHVSYRAMCAGVAASGASLCSSHKSNYWRIVLS
jgi:hypothetical protein